MTFLAVALNSYAQKADSISSAKPDSIWKDVQLQGVTVKGKNLIRRRGKDIWIITDEMRQHTFSTYDVTPCQYAFL